MDNVDAFVQKYQYVVYRNANKIKRKVPSSVELADLVGYGLAVLPSVFEANKHPIGSKQFFSYLNVRVRGAMIDGLRATAPQTRSARRLKRTLDAARNRAEQKLLRQVRDREVAEEMGISLERYHEIRKETTRIREISCTDAECLIDAQYCDPADSLDHLFIAAEEELSTSQQLAAAIRTLDLKLQSVVHLRVYEELSHPEVGKHYNVGGSRACRLYKQAEGQLKAHFQ